MILPLNDQLSLIGQSITGIVPELFLTLFFLLFLVAELLFARFGSQATMRRWLFIISLTGALGFMVLVLNQWNEPPAFRFEKLLFLDQKAVFFKLLIAISWLFALIHIRLIRYHFPAELNSLLITSVLGMSLLCMATHWLTIYLALELISLSSYLLVAISPYKKAAEGGLKYLLFGAISSAVMLYGISLLYGLTATLDLTAPGLAEALAANTPLVLYVAMLMTLGGILFKLSLAPFHVWTPDVYEAAPTPLVSFLSVAPKVAVLLVLLRVASAWPAELLQLLGGVALVSITLGNVSALWQQNARRLLAYSSIAQAGYLLVGLVAFNQLGFESATFYVAVYVLLNMSAFLLIDFILPRTETKLSDFEGLGRKHIFISVILTVVMVALAGLPPTAGFMAKWLIFSALWNAYQIQGQPWMLWLLIGGILNAAIALVYYLRIPYLLFFKKQTAIPATTTYGIGAKVIAGLLLVAIFGLFFKPEYLLQWINLLSNR